MGNCIICGTSTDGLVCEIHEEDVVFEFEGNDPSQLIPGRFYQGNVDGYAEFGVFVNIGNVTGLLHRSKLDRRLESLEWDVGDDICVQVNNVRENGDIDLDWSIRQSKTDFRGALRQTPDGDQLLESDEEDEPEDESDEEAPETAPKDEPDADQSDETETPVSEDDTSDSELTGIVTESDDQTADETEETVEDEIEPEEDAAEPDRVPVESLRDHVGETVRLEGRVVSVRQTSGPTVFELRDETGTVDCAAFVEAGVRAYPEIEADDVARLDGEVRLRREEVQIETDDIVSLDDEAAADVKTRRSEALDDRASPESIEPLADDPQIEAATEEIEAVATEIHRAVLESRPIVIRHDATTDGYVAGAAIERAVLPLIEAEHGTADSVYHYFDRRPLEDGVYDMNDATKDATRMLGDRDRHGEKLPLFVFAAAGSTAASADGFELLDIYDAPRIVLDGRPVDEAIVEDIDSLVTVENRTATTVAATVAAAVNDEIRDDVRHLPAVSYWEDTPEAYVELAAAEGIDADDARQLRQAIALEAFYQSYEDKRELIIDLLFEKRTGLAAQVSEQFTSKLEAELDTATPNLEERTVGDTTVTILDTDAYTHRYDFPNTRLLLDELARRLDSDAVIGVGTDELQIRTDGDLDLDGIVSKLKTTVPNAGVSNPGTRQPKIEFLAGERDAVIDAVVDAVVEGIAAPSV